MDGIEIASDLEKNIPRNYGSSTSNHDSGVQFDEIKHNKSKIKRKRKKKNKSKSKNVNNIEINSENDEGILENESDKTDDIIIEYIPEIPELDPYDPNYRHFLKVFNNFKLTSEAINNPKGYASRLNDPLAKSHEFVRVNKLSNIHQLKEAPVFEEKDDDDDLLKKKKDYPTIDEEGDEKPEKLSKKKWKKLNRLSVAELKQLVKRPDVVEMHDVTSHDPKLLVTLKATKNTVPVARHWCYKRKYLAGKRGFEKSPFNLPDFIKKTGIMEMRQALQEKEDHSSLKSKMRAKIRPKMGKIDIDYQKLHDAFFRWQTKPKMTIHGDLYFEGKELELQLREKKPGDLSDALRESLGMPTGMGCEKVAPPWLIAMQRYGPPPSYPDLRIQGLNAPIPEGCSFGYHMGGWGKPPVDEFGNPLYGDVFNTRAHEYKGAPVDEEVDKTPWGELESGSEDEEESSEDEAIKLPNQNIEGANMGGLITPSEPGLITPSGLASTPMIGIGGGLQTPEVIELRKKKQTIEHEMEAGSEIPTLYKVLPQKASSNPNADFLASSHVYDMSSLSVQSGLLSSSLLTPNPSGLASVPSGIKSGLPGAVEISLAPEELDLVNTRDALSQRYERQLRASKQQAQARNVGSTGLGTGTMSGTTSGKAGAAGDDEDDDDLSDMVAQHAARQKNKRKKQQEKEVKASNKKYKDFKF
ncbi:unnamed protein product [Gordionus sp. m RMFG-2023]|uniref:splicing factor 3B subunit 2-like n=1 Tax=Gordionus sp. m RMFG-2023 TaxID=3053472 RepID=UPI0030E2BAF1